MLVELHKIKPNLRDAPTFPLFLGQLFLQKVTVFPLPLPKNPKNISYMYILLCRKCQVLLWSMCFAKVTSAWNVCSFSAPHKNFYNDSSSVQMFLNPSNVSQAELDVSYPCIIPNTSGVKL